MEEDVASTLAKLGMGLYGLTFEEYGLTSLLQLPSEHGERDLLLAELGVTPNDRWRLHEVVRDRRNLERLAQLRAEPDPFDAASIRRQREANEARKAAFDASVATAGSVSDFAAVSAAHISQALCAEPLRVLAPSAFGSTLATSLVLDEHVATLARDRLVVIDGALDAGTIERARLEGQSLGLQPTVQDASRVRGDEVCWIDVRDGSQGIGQSNAALASCAQLLVGVLARLNEALPPSARRSDAPHRVMLARYGQAAGYKPHYDNPAADARAGADDERRRREWTLILYLNEYGSWPAERGGLLRCQLPAPTLAPAAEPAEPAGGRAQPCGTAVPPPVEIAPAGGRLVVFDSATVLHEVLPVVEPGAERYALTLWSVRRGAEEAAAQEEEHRRGAPPAPTRALAPAPALAAGPASATPSCRVVVLFASVGAALEQSAGGCSLAIENGGFLALLHGARVPCAHAALDAEAVLAEMRATKIDGSGGRGYSVGPGAAAEAEAEADAALAAAAEQGAAAELDAAQAYARAVRARLASAPPVDWSRVPDGEQLSALALRPGCALLKALCAGASPEQPPRAKAPVRVLLVLDGYDVLHGLTVPALAAVALAQLSACGGALGAQPCGGVRTAVRVMAESDRIGAAAARRLGHADALWVPAQNSEAALRASGIGGAASVRTLPQLTAPSSLPHRGLASEPGSAAEGGARADGRQRGDFTFTLLSIAVGTDGWHFSRKGIDVLLRAFSSALCRPDSRGARLLLKLGSAVDADRVRAYLRAADGGQLAWLLGSEQLELLVGWQSAQQLEALVARCDALVMPSRGEGWCRPLADAMALGKAVVGVPGAGGPAAFLDESVGWCVRSAAVPVEWRPSADAARPPVAGGSELGEWAEPDAEHLALILRELYLDAARGGTEAARRGAAAAARMRERYSAAPIQARLVELVGELAAD